MSYFHSCQWEQKLFPAAYVICESLVLLLSRSLLGLCSFLHLHRSVLSRGLKGTHCRSTELSLRMFLPCFPYAANKFTPPWPPLMLVSVSATQWDHCSLFGSPFPALLPRNWLHAMSLNNHRTYLSPLRCLVSILPNDQRCLPLHQYTIVSKLLIIRQPPCARSYLCITYPQGMGAL